MKTKIFPILLIICALLWTGQLFGQETSQFKRTDVVYLKNGSIFRGQIEYYEVNKELKLRLNLERVIVFDAKNIKKIVQEATDEEQSQSELKQIKTYNFRERGTFFASHIGYIGGNNLFGNYTDAFNIHALGGYQFNRFVSAGLGVGVDFYNVNLGSIIPVYAMTRGYLKKANVSPYYQLAAGYGFPIQNEDSFFDEASGGYYLSPELGFRFGGSAEANFTMGFGLQWQKATYRQDFGDGISNNQDTYTFRRFNFKIGVLF